MELCHAAVQWAGAEAMGGVAYTMNPDFGRCWIAVTAVNIDFISVARTDLCVTARFPFHEQQRVLNELDGQGKSRFQLNVSLYDSNETLVTEARGAYYLRRSRAK